jgi:hypothetical protein
LCVVDACDGGAEGSFDLHGDNDSRDAGGAKVSRERSLTRSGEGEGEGEKKEKERGKEGATRAIK